MWKKEKKKAFSLKIPFINIPWTIHTSPLNCCQNLSEITWKIKQKWDYKVSYGYLILFSVSTVKGYLQNTKECSHISRWVSTNMAEDNHCRWMPQFSQASEKYIQHGGAWVWAFIWSAFDERKQFLVLGFVSKAQRTRGAAFGAACTSQYTATAGNLYFLCTPRGCLYRKKIQKRRSATVWRITNIPVNLKPGK